MKLRALVIDDDAALRDWIEAHLQGAGFEVELASSAQAARRALAAGNHDVVVLDLLLPDARGTDLLPELRRERPLLPVVMVTASDSIENVVECMRAGAADFVEKPLDRLRFLTSVRNAAEQGRLRASLAATVAARRSADGVARILGSSPAIVRTREQLLRAADTDATLLLLGETGTGKEVAARAVHAESARAERPFVAVNCGALPEHLAESELFGHERGAFTGATEARAGIFERAHTGVVFLDELGELRLALQVKLLRVLQERTLTRVGGNRERAIDVRIIAATHRDPAEERRKGRLRDDLYYRLNVLTIRIPPLRDRRTDVLPLAEHFLASHAATAGVAVPTLGPRARQALVDYPWPGNVRELQNAMERAVVLSAGRELELEDLTDDIVCRSFEPTDAGVAPPQPEPEAGTILPLDEEERRIVLRALELTGWNVVETARRLGIGRATIYRKLHAWGLDPQPRPEAPRP
ncbi:MAG: sigma-54 dependent transcriptional regulator [Planctomycetota bacterium]|nr:sigma-54 dependent transcriptional regulator [Planctomycetota bacterium]